MKKIKRLNQLKNDRIMNVNYVIADLLYKSIKAENDWNRMYRIIYDSTLSKQKKYDKLRDILMKGGE